MLQNKSRLISGSLTKSMCYDRLASMTGGKKKGGCTRCRDKFGMDASVYSTHRVNSISCPTAEMKSPEKKRRQSVNIQGRVVLEKKPSRKRKRVDSSIVIETPTAAVLSQKRKKVQATMTNKWPAYHLLQ